MKILLRPSGVIGFHKNNLSSFSSLPISLPLIQRIAIYFVLSVLAVAIYLTIALIKNGDFGFPLDDAWIHQVYARNLGTHGEFSFFVGQPSSGSTSPLWAILLSISYALDADFRVWTVFLGILFLALTAWLGSVLARQLTPVNLISLWLVPIFLIFEWHLVWAAVSGMEILLFIFLSLALLDLFLIPPDFLHKNQTQYFVLGTIAGLLILARPEGIVLGGLIGLGILVRAKRLFPTPFSIESNLHRSEPSILSILLYLLAAALVLSPYLAFNSYTGGSLLPNTFYAKSQEYAELLTRSNFLLRWLNLYRQPFIGAQILLLPGLIWFARKLVVTREWELCIPLAWILLLPAIYAERLPVEYQFGRYMMPLIPFTIIYGVVGSALVVTRVHSFVVRRVWEVSLAILLIAFFALGAQLYSGSVAIVNCETVATARWTSANLPSGDLLAVHDIGAQGYFDSHRFLDLAGLVSPEVIPFVRDEGKLLLWMQARGVAFAIFFPDWYPQLGNNPALHTLHSENCDATHLAGGDDLNVYELIK